MAARFLRSFGSSLFVINIVLYFLLREIAWRHGLAQLSVALVGLLLAVIGLALSLNIKRMSWYETEYQRDYNNLLTPPCVGVQSLDRQPGFSIEIGWNEPSQLLKPFFTVLIWRWRAQCGWLNEYKSAHKRISDTAFR